MRGRSRAIARIPAKRRPNPRPWRKWDNAGLHVRRILYRPPVGWHDRESYINREQVFAEEWEKDNPIRWEGSSRTLHCLFFVHDRRAPRRMIEGPDSTNGRWAFGGPPTYRDRVVAATVIQWLGSNVGFAFVETALRKCGYRVSRIDEAFR